MDRRALLRGVKGALFGIVVILVCTVMALFDGLQKALEFGVASGFLTVAHLCLAVFSRQIVSGLRGLPWFRERSWTESDAGLLAAQFGVGLTALCFLVAFFTVGPGKAAALGLVIVPLILSAYAVAYRRRLVTATVQRGHLDQVPSQ